MKICFCGGGNGTHVGSVLLAVDNHIVNIFTRKPSLWNTNLKLKLENKNDYYKSQFISANINKISDKPEDVIPGVQIIFISSPVSAYENIIENINPYISDNTIIGVLFGQGHIDLMMKKYIFDYEKRNITFFALQYIPWQAKTIEYGKIGYLVGEKKNLLLSVFPKKNEEIIKGYISKLFRMNVNTQHFLSNCLTTSNQILHPVRYYIVFKNCNKDTIINKENIPILYTDMDIESANYLSKVSHEILLIKNNISDIYKINLENVLSLEERIKLQYGDLVKDYTNIKTIFNTATMYTKSKFAMLEVSDNNFKININHRHFTDDIPYGLVVLKNISLSLKINTPYIDELIYWCQKLMGKEYLINNKLIGKDISETGIFNNYNIKNINDIM